MKKKGSRISRREFIGSLTAVGALALSCGKSGSEGGAVSGSGIGYTLPPLLDRAPDGPLLKAGLIGCGGRGTGAAGNFLEAGPNLKVVALADVFPDRIARTKKILEEKYGQTIPKSRCFTGLDGYKKLLDTDVDVVLMATPPYYRPEQFAAAVEAGKHTFIEKPVAVDPVGAKIIMEAAAKAKTKGLCSVSGTNARHDRKTIEIYKRVRDGAIGEIVAARAYFNTNQLWYRLRKPGWTDLEWMIRDWVNWCWLSGDHIVEQHIHKLDAINWFMGDHPVKTVGFGGRARRVTGDQYDFFANDYVFENGVHLQSMCRQLDGAATNYTAWVVGTKGAASYRDAIYRRDGSILYKYEGKPISSYVQEHIDLVTAIRTGEQRIEAVDTAISTLVAVMGRISAYTGKEVTWQEMMDSDLRLGPPTDKKGNIKAIVRIPVPGVQKQKPRPV